ncbi:MAG: exosortase/archaeosortase family protein [Bacteroidetes bacterium]|nr:exosortase/archaeosortase family protein [Bacteroidota bacterium]
MKNKIPKPVKLFLLKAALLFAAWKLVYLLYLLPHRTLDRPLSFAIAAGTTTSLNAFAPSRPYSTRPGNHVSIDADGHPVHEKGMDIFRGQEKVLYIADVCNGLELLVLYAGLIICLPSPARRKLLFIAGGFVFIEVINVLRCMALVRIYLRRPEWLDFTHHYLFSFLVYAAIFWLWYVFSRDPAFTKKMHLHAPVSVQ